MKAKKKIKFKFWKDLWLLIGPFQKRLVFLFFLTLFFGTNKRLRKYRGFFYTLSLLIRDFVRPVREKMT